ncbi:MAG: long-chain fatty acid--CoA ligase [Actinomycetota bacterium]|nr:long-chain fatty acid--CoA ligase [Actinomycetota bacterium]
MNLAALLRSAAESAGAKPALVSSSSTIDFATFDREADRVAAWLASSGVGPGDRVALAMGNVPHFAFAYFGSLRAGAVVVPINVLLTVDEVRRVLEDSGASVVIAAPGPGDAAIQSASELGVSTLTTDRWDELGDPTPVAIDRDDDDLAVLAYTSGTTGDPKGAMLTHGNLLANLQQQQEIAQEHVSSADVLLLALPLFHIFGLNVTLGQLVLNGATGVLVERFDPIAALKTIQEQRVTIVFGAPTMYLAWLDTPGAEQYDLSSVRWAVSGAAPLPADTISRFKSVFGVDIFEGYGLTETAPTVTTNRVARKPRPGSIGKPVPGIDVRLVDEDGNDVELGDPGEIVVRGPNVFKGYWNREEETARAFRDGWFRTGDVAVSDEDGYLYIVDRKRDLIIVSGFNVFPNEVESALLENPDIAEAAVVGAPHPYTGETVKAFVQLNAGADTTERELMADVQSRLARFKAPTSIEIVDELPHVVTGKVLRRALRT